MGILKRFWKKHHQNVSQISNDACSLIQPFVVRSRNQNTAAYRMSEIRTEWSPIPRRSDFGHLGLFERLELVRTKKVAKLGRFSLKWS